MNKIWAFFVVVIFLAIALSFLGEKSFEKHMQVDVDEIVKIGVVQVGPNRDGGWCEAHYNGFEYAKNKLGNVEILYRENVSDQDNSMVAVIDELAAAKASIIFLASFDYNKYLKECAEKYPHIKFFHATGYQTGNNIANYFGRIYQARYLTGIVAGLQTKTNHIGYVAAHPIPEVVRGINAFTLGVRSVNPLATVHVKWTYQWNQPQAETDATNELLDKYPIDVMAQHQNTINPVAAAAKRNVWSIGYNLDRAADFSKTFLTAPVWNWGPFYVEQLTECFEGRFKGKAYLGNIADDILDVAPLTPLVVDGTKEKVAAAKQKIISKRWDVFYGPIYDQNGVLRVKEGECMSDADMFGTFNWFVQGVEGKVE